MNYKYIVYYANKYNAISLLSFIKYDTTMVKYIFFNFNRNVKIIYNKTCKETKIHQNPQIL